MKKLIMAVAIVCATAFAQAATVTWGSGTLNTAASKDGGWSSTGVVAAGALVNMSVYLISAESWANDAVASMSQKDLYDYVAEKSATYTAQNKNSSGTIIGAISAKDASFPGSETFYSIVVAEYTDATYGDMYMAKAVTDVSPASGSKSLSNLLGGTTGIRDWQPVPEPTSGLLILLGMAGLALKRKQA